LRHFEATASASSSIRYYFMAYSVIQPPFTLDFQQMSRSELLAYRDWFHSVSRDRIAQLAAAMNASEGFECWTADFTPKSLAPLSQWFRTQAATRERTPDEIAEIRGGLAFPIEISTQELTNRTYSLAMDIAFYFAEVILTNIPGTRWDQPLRGKTLADYGQPVLVGLRPVPINPVRVMIVIARGFADGSKPDDAIPKLYERWVAERG
jgi:hypothetical protein